MRSVEEWTAHWDAKSGIADPVALNGYCIDGVPLSMDTYREVVIGPILERLELEDEHRVLEVGCGSGLLLNAIEKRAGECMGVDPSATMIARYRGNASTRVCGAHELDFPAGHFDRVVMAGVALYFPTTEYFEGVIHTCLRLLRQPGIVFVGDLLLGKPPPGAQYRYYDRHYLVDFLDGLGHPYSLAAQSAAKRRINQRSDLIIYKD